MTAASLERAWQELAADLRRFLRRRVRDREAAEDLLQDVFVKAAHHLDGGGDATALPAWLFHVARNAVVDHYRTRKTTEDLGAERVDERTAAPDARELGCLQRSFRRFVHGLPPRYREALLLTAYQGLTQRELAERIGVTVSAAKSRVQRGRALLERALLDCCELELDRRGRIIDWRRRDGRKCRDC